MAGREIGAPEFTGESPAARTDGIEEGRKLSRRSRPAGAGSHFVRRYTLAKLAHAAGAGQLALTTP
jgi:hypothetical protein